MITHYEVFVLSISIGSGVLGSDESVKIAQISPINTEEEARQAGKDLQQVYSVEPGRVCMMHCCTHSRAGVADVGCTEDVLWTS